MEDWAKRLNGKMAGFTEPVSGAAPVVSGAGKVAAGLWWALGAVAAAAAVAGIVVLSRPVTEAPVLEVSAPMIAQEQYPEEILPEETLPVTPVRMISETVTETAEMAFENPVLVESVEVAEELPHDDVVIDEKPDNETFEDFAWPISWENPVVRKRRHFDVSLFAHMTGRRAVYESSNNSPVVDNGNDTPPMPPVQDNPGTGNTPGNDLYGDYVGDDVTDSGTSPEEGDPDTKAGSGSGNQAVADPAQDPIMHRLPLHLGVRISTEIGCGFSIETGLDYARFVSVSDNAKQQLHYIGVPARLRYDVLDARYYSAGVSVGAEAMKCVAGNGPDKPWLFDIGASLEAEWKITPRVGIYAETGIGRYFHTGQSQHYYTQNPVSVSFSLGLRFEL